MEHSRERGTAPPAERRRERFPSAATEAFFRLDGGRPDVLIVVYHIQKTAGTALRKLVRDNLPPAERVVTPDLRDLRFSPGDSLAWYRRWYASLDADRRSRLCCVMSHSAGYLLPALERPAETLVLVREPLDRILSLHYFQLGHRRKTRKRPRPTLAQIYGKQPSERGVKWSQYANWQSRSLLSVFYDVSTLERSAGPGRDADVWRGRLRELVENGVFFVGVQERFAQYVELLSRRFGWAPFVPQAKVNRARPPVAELSPELRETILAYNWLDTELHELCRATQLRREAALAA